VWGNVVRAKVEKSPGAEQFEFSEIGRDPRFPPGWWVFTSLLMLGALWVAFTTLI
jgi:hypothetical protein